MSKTSWICCQIGAREHYAIPRALNQDGKLAAIITDAWVGANSLFRIVTQTGLKERFHTDLAQVQVYAFNNSLIRFEITQKIQKHFGWAQIIARNQWFQDQAIKKLTELAPQFNTPPILFSYSYAALDIFRFAKKQGWKTVLGQIDPGILEEKIVSQEHEKHPQYQSKWEPAPSIYWQNWQEECKLADAIIVNSDWSRQLIENAGIETNKLKIVPLVYTSPETAKNFIRLYPASFSKNRPLRVLFLGQVILRKGIAYILEAIKSLEGYPIEFWFVGSNQVEVPYYFENHPQIRWIGHINRSETARYYQLADVFLFPTLSDGFGLTQLEAQSWQMPIIASSNCGDVVRDGVNGLLLSKVSSEVIVKSLYFCLQNPQELNQSSQNTQKRLDEFSLSILQKELALITLK